MAVREVDVVYLYEHAARELDVACAITALLQEEYGLRVEIVHWPTGFPRALMRIRPRLVILPFCYTERPFDALLSYWREAIFFNITWEQLFYSGNRKAKTPVGEFALKHVIHHAWSEQYASFLRVNGLPDDLIFLNGQPAYTLYDEPYRRYFASREDLASRYGLDPVRRWIFFPENYNWAFYSEASLKYFIDKGQSAEEVSAMREYCNLSLKEVIPWFAEAAREENAEIILRPRPATTLEEFRVVVNNVLPEIPLHLHIIQRETVREWILASDVVLSSHSTSMIEAAIAGKPAYLVEPYSIPATLRAEWHTLLPHIRTRTEFLEICHGTAVSSEPRLAKWARETLMGRGDSIKRLVEYLADLLSGKRRTPSYPSRDVAVPSVRWIPPAWMWSAYRRLKQWIRYGKTAGLEPEYVKDVVEQDRLELLIRKWAQLLVGSKVTSE